MPPKRFLCSLLQFAIALLRERGGRSLGGVRLRRGLREEAKTSTDASGRSRESRWSSSRCKSTSLEICGQSSIQHPALDRTYRRPSLLTTRDSFRLVPNPLSVNHGNLNMIPSAPSSLPTELLISRDELLRRGW